MFCLESKKEKELGVFVVFCVVYISAMLPVEHHKPTGALLVILASIALSLLCTVDAKMQLNAIGQPDTKIVLPSFLFECSPLSSPFFSFFLSFVVMLHNL